MATTSVASTTTSTQLIAQNPSRTFVAIENTDANVLYLLIGPGTASATHYTVSLSTGDYYEVPKVASGLELTGVWAADGTGIALITTI